MKIYIFYLLALITMSCSIPGGEGQRLWVQLKMPEEYPNLTPKDTEVKLINTLNGTTYKTLADANGLAVFEAEHGIYRVSAQLRHDDNLISHLFNAGIENIRLTTVGGIGQDTLLLKLIDSPLNKIVIKEIYYSGCYDDNGKIYNKDAYVSLYNNSDNTLWLDSLCVGVLGPMVAYKQSPWLSQPDSLPIVYFGWQFPGTGKEHPLLPGEETVIAINAINHTSTEYNHPNSVDLSKSDWAFYNNVLSNADISAGVTPLNMFLRIGPITSFVLPVQGPGFVLYQIKGCSAAEYASNNANLRAEPPTYKGTNYLMIPSEWILDCVDCVEDANKQGFKRVPSFLDAETVFLPSGKNSGRALQRKLASNENGRITYQDSNNSANDFEEIVPTQKGKQK